MVFGARRLQVAAWRPRQAPCAHAFERPRPPDAKGSAVLTGSRQAALQALLLDPVVHSARAAEQTLETILERQADYLGYLK